MMTYLFLNVAFLLTLFVVLNLVLRKTPWKEIGLTLIGTSALTLIFDNVIVATGIVDYNPEKTLGILLGVAPIEDFAYTIAAALLIPSMWILLGKKKVR